MRFLDLTLPTPAENLALDEALLLSIDTAGCRTQATLDSRSSATLVASEMPAEGALLRVWSTGRPMVVLGRSSRVQAEVYTERAAALDVPILRRCSGGATVALGPGCIVYSVLLHLDSCPGLRMLDTAHRYVMDRMLQAIRTFERSACFDGTCDLVLQEKKFSGNSLRVGRNWMLYHGTLLLGMNLRLIDQLLRHPPKEPSYRSGRSHADFVTNLSVDSVKMIQALRHAWHAWQPAPEVPWQLIADLVQERYGNPAWNLLR
jgi:lipoate-protein ligase A